MIKPTKETGRIYGVGLGPGDPELMSVRADRLIRQAQHIAFFRKTGCIGRARKIVEDILPKTTQEFPMEYPVTTEIPISDPAYNQSLAHFYETCCEHLKNLAKQGKDIAVLCEGDPFFYGSFMHLYTRLRHHIPIEIIPAITGMSAAWTATGQPITWGDDILSIVMGTLNENDLTAALSTPDALVVMKIGHHLDKIRRALASASKLERAWLVEYASMTEQSVQPLLQFKGTSAPYFSIIIVHGQGRRP